MSRLAWILLLLGLVACCVDAWGRGHGGDDDDDDDDYRRRRFGSHYDDDHYGRGKHYDSDEKDDHDDDKEEDKKPFWNATGGIIILGFVGCGLVSLVTWLVLLCYRKCNKVQISNGNAVSMTDRKCDAPTWSALLYYKPSVAGPGFGTVSKGFNQVSANEVVRTRPGLAQADGAKWGVGMLSGKHVFEITWPWGQRGKNATVGVGTAKAPTQKKGACRLVGGCGQSWGIDIVARQVLHNNRLVRSCPTDGSYVPDRFFMYVDMDTGTLGFGNDVTYWGEVINNLPTDGVTQLYVMVGSCKYNSHIRVSYKGSEGGDFATIASSYALPPLYGDSCPEKPPPYPVTPPPQVKGSRPSSASSQVINVEGYRPPGGDTDTHREEPPPYCSPPPGYSP